MKQFSVRIEIKLKPVVLDPEGKAVLNALNGLGFDGVSDVRTGKIVELAMEGESSEKVSLKADEMCRKLLCNPVIENSSIEIKETKDA